MEDQHSRRKLAAIMAADVAGYSRLMSHDEEGTLRRLKEHVGELVEPHITAHQGRIVKRTGDGLLVDFASAIEAVRCAVAIQAGMADRNRTAPESRRIEFRIGINVGDIIIEGEDIYGDGVNVAARLESIAEPGAIFVSRAVRDSVRDKLEVVLEDLGEVPVKNIARPVRVFRIARAEGARSEPLPPPVPDKPSVASRRRRSMADLRNTLIRPAAAYELTAAAPGVRSRLDATAGSRLVYVIPEEWFVPDLPVDPPTATNRAPHGSRDFDRSRLKVLFARPRSHTAEATGAAIVTSAYGLDPLAVAHLDMAAGRVTAVDDPPHHVRWGDIPTPLF